MLTRSLFGALTLLAVACGAPAQPTPQTPAPSPGDTAPNTAALADIEAFFAAPSLATARPVVRFVGASPAVLVVYRPAFTDDPASDEAQGPLLLAAYAAGNARAQLRDGEKRDMPVEGVRGVLALYAKWKESQPDLELSTLEAFARAEAAGTLEQAVEDAITDGG